MIKEYLNYLIASMKCVSGKLPKSKFNKAQKPYWCQNLTKASKAQKKSWIAWKHAGQPRDKTNQLYVQYKNSKREFRKAQRSAEREYEQIQMNELVKYCSVDQKYFWHVVNKSRKKSKRGCQPVKVNGTIISDPDDVCEAWRNHFTTLYREANLPHYNSNFKSEVDNAVMEMEAESHYRENHVTHNSFTFKEVSDLCKKLKKNKAPGFDSISPEHILYGGDMVICILTGLFSAMMRTERIPSELKMGVIVPIPKGNKDHTEMDNNRGITLIPVIGKLYERALLDRHLSWSRENQIIDDLQGAGQEHCSSLHTTWLLREAISANREKGATVYVGLLDTRKAFDTVWINGLLYKLFKTGMDGKLWRIMKDMYSDFKCCIQTGGIHSSWFLAEQGLHQGAPWSMYNYQVFNNEMIRMLKKSKDSIAISDINISNPAFADDISIATIYKKSLQRQFNIAFNYSQDWRFEFNAAKSAILIFGTDSDHQRTVLLGDSPVAVVDSCPHMGVSISSTTASFHEFVRDRCSSGKRAFFAIHGIGSKSCPVIPTIGSKLYWSISIPRMTYGLEIVDLDRTSIAKLESTHSDIAKQLQGLPKQAVSSGCIASLGWVSVETYIQLMQLLFIWRILLLPASNIYKQVAIVRLCHHLYNQDGKHTGPTYLMVKSFRKFGLEGMLLEAIEDGSMCKMSTFKRVAKKAVKAYEEKCFKCTTGLFSMLSLFRECISSIDMWKWWYVAAICPSVVNKCKVLVKLMFRETCLKSSTYRFKGNNISLCQMCSEFEEETVTHVLMSCTYYNDIRTAFWDKICKVAPQCLVHEIESMTPYKQVVFFISCFNSGIVQEWLPVYMAILDFVSLIYKRRQGVD